MAISMLLSQMMVYVSAYSVASRPLSKDDKE